MGQSQGKLARKAAKRGDLAALREVASADTGALLKPSFWKQRTSLHAAASRGAVSALAFVLTAASQHTAAAAAASASGDGRTLSEFVNAPDSAGDTALALASKNGHGECVILLLEDGASPLPANSQGVTALHYAAVRGQAACVSLLLEAPVRLADGRRCRAADAPVPDVIDTERYIDARSHAGLCALHLAVLSGSEATVRKLVVEGAQLDTPVLAARLRSPPLRMPVFLSTGSTALHICAATGREPLCITLLVAQQQRHPGLELRRMRNSRGMTPLNIALLCGHRHLAPLLVVGGTFHAPMLPSGRSRGGAVGSSADAPQMPQLLRLQLLSLVHRAHLLSQLRLLGLGSGAAHVPPLAWEAPEAVQRLEELLLSDIATAEQVLEALDELLGDTGPAGLGDGGGRSSLFEAPGARGRRQRRQAEERQEVSQALASAQAGVDWSLLDRNQTLWHAEHSSSLYRRLRRRRERQRHPIAGAAPAGAAAHASLVDATAALQALTAGHGNGDDAGSPGSSGGGSSAGASDAEQQQAQGAGAAAGKAALAAAGDSQADGGAVCPVCLDRPPGIALSPCGHCACLACCRCLASYCMVGGGTRLPANGPLCPLCRAPIEAFERAQ